MAGEAKPRPVKAGQIKGVKVNPLTAEEEKTIKDALPRMYDVTSAGDFIKPLENEDTGGKPKLKAHKDVNKKLIVGYGTQADDLKEGDTITEADAQHRLNVKLGDIIDSIKRNGGGTAWEQMSQGEKDALLSTMHNVGASGVIYSRKPGEKGQYTEFWKAIISGDKEKAAKENDFGQLPGHKKRRGKENERAGRTSSDMAKAIKPENVTGRN